MPEPGLRDMTATHVFAGSNPARRSTLVTMKCYGCGRDDIPESGFAPSVWKRRKGMCRECQGNYNKKNYDGQRQWLDNLKSVPCTDCGISYPPYVMDFDHRDPITKRNQVSNLLGCSRHVIQTEIDKCDVVCANCHRERTHGCLPSEESSATLSSRGRSS